MKSAEITSKSWSINSEDLKGIDVVLLSLVIALVLFGLLMVYSSSYIYAQERTGDGFAFIKKQFLFVIIGFTGMIAALRIPPLKWKEWAYPISLGAIGLLALVLIPGVGSKVSGAQRWLRLGFFSIQPAEIAKFAMIVFVAKQLDKKRDILSRFVPGVVAPFVLPLPAMLLLLLQPDFGSVVIIGAVIYLLLFVAGVPKRYLAGMVTLAGAAATFLILSAPYRRARLMTFLDPWKDPLGKGFQVLQSMLGVHNGGFWGVGLGNGKEKLFYLPEAHNDFIFAVIGEELGFLGVIGVIFAYCFLIYRGLKIASNRIQLYGDLFGGLLACGITVALGIQAFVNIGVVLGLLPTKGLTLPFISYGGSALIVDLFAIGILLSISRSPQPSTVKI